MQTSSKLISQSLKQHIQALTKQPPHVLLVEAAHAHQANNAAAYIVQELLSQHSLTNAAVVSIDGSEVGIEDIREINRVTQTRNAQSLSRIVLIRNFDTLNDPSQNAMLKMLEEPVSGVVYILGATGESVLKTISSRAKVIHVQPLTLDDYAQAYPDKSSEEIEQAVSISRGDAVMAESYLNAQLDDLETAKQILASSKLERLLLSESLAKDRDKAIELVTYIQNVLLYLLKQQTRKHQYAKATRLIVSLEASQTTLRNLRNNGNGKIALDNLFISI